MPKFILLQEHQISEANDERNQILNSSQRIHKHRNNKSSYNNANIQTDMSSRNIKIIKNEQTRVPN